MISGQFDTESKDEEINAELDSLLLNSLPEVPADKIPIKNKKGFCFIFISFYETFIFKRFDFFFKKKSPEKNQKKLQLKRIKKNF